MKHKLQRRSNIFLLEVIIAILFFSISSAVCIQLFAQAHIKSENAASLNQAVLAASSAAEALEACGGDAESLSELFPESRIEGDTLHVYYDADWNCCPSSDAYRNMDIVLSVDGGLIRGEIAVFEIGKTKPLYQLDAEYYMGDSV